MKTITLVLLCLFLFSGCSLPRIVIIDDPLSAQQRNELGFIYETQGKLDLAKKEYTLATKKDKAWAVPWFNLGNVSYKMGDHQKAKLHYREALKRDRECPDVMNNLAYVLYKDCEYEEAEKWINRALAIRQDEAYLDTKKQILEAKNGGPPAESR